MAVSFQPLPADIKNRPPYSLYGRRFFLAYHLVGIYFSKHIPVQQGAGADTQLGKKVFQIHFYGVRRNVQHFGNLDVGVPLSRRKADLPFPRGERGAALCLLRLPNRSDRGTVSFGSIPHLSEKGRIGRIDGKPAKQRRQVRFHSRERHRQPVRHGKRQRRC